MTELQELLHQKAEQLDIVDVNMMLDVLAQKKTKLETVKFPYFIMFLTISIFIISELPSNSKSVTQRVSVSSSKTQARTAGSTNAGNIAN